VGVDVDEAGRHERAVGVDRAVRRARDAADRDDPVALDRNVAGESGSARPVDDGAAADHEIVGHGLKVALGTPR
jgi:hypothetical protein